MIVPEWLFYWLLVMWSLIILRSIMRILAPFYLERKYISGKAKMRPTVERFYGILVLIVYIILLGWLLGYIKF